MSQPREDVLQNLIQAHRGAQDALYYLDAAITALGDQPDLDRSLKVLRDSTRNLRDEISLALGSAVAAL